MRDDDGEQRRRGVEDRGDAARDVALAPGDEGERDGVVEDAHAEEGDPDPPLARQRHAHEAQRHEKGRRRKRDARDDDRQRRQLGDRDADEQERAAPQHREPDEERPFGRRHARVDRGLRHPVVP